MTITPRHTVAITAIAFYLSLVLHDTYLYRNLSVPHAMALSLLRFFLIAIPLVAAVILTKKPAGWKRWFAWTGWLFFLPYTIYSMAEIRHVSETCRLTTKLFYTESCVEHAWHLLPVFIYAFVGTLVFVWSVVAVCSRYIANSTRKRLVILLLCFYTAFASVFGLYSRFNMWGLLYQPRAVASAIFETMSRPHFFENVLAFTLFFATITLVAHRMLRYAHQETET